MKYEEDDLEGITELVEVINLQVTGPAEASRCIRKKLKYTGIHSQIRALTVSYPSPPGPDWPPAPRG